MSPSPPIQLIKPSRRAAPGRRLPARLGLAVAIVVLAGGCGSTPPVRPSLAATAHSATAAPATAATDPATIDPETIEGLLVATGEPLQVTDVTGGIVAFDGPADRVAFVSVGSDKVVAVNEARRSWFSAASGQGARSWTMLALPTDTDADPPVPALSPSGTRLAMASGEFQGRAFDLIVFDLATSASRTIEVSRGLDGSPTWIGEDHIAVHAIRADQTSGIALVEASSANVTDIAASGYVVAATADGLLVAVDDPATGETLVGSRDAWQANDRAGMIRIPRSSEGGVDGLAIDATGTRLAIQRRADAASTIEVLALRDERWFSVRTLTLNGDPSVSLAWLH